MSDSPRRSIAAALAAVLLLPAGAWAQEPPAPVVPAEAARQTGAAGTWIGWARLTNDWPGAICRYESATDVVAIRLELQTTGPGSRGSVAIDVAAEPGSACPPLRKRFSIGEVRAEGDAVAFTDTGGHEWTLSLRRDGEVLAGALAWQQGGPTEPLAEGFSTPGGQRPLTRLGGEVRLRREGAAAEGSEAASDLGEGAAAAEEAKLPKKGAGGHVKDVAAVLGANAVALGLLWGANELGQGSEAGVLTCSPRVCIVGAPNQPCFCEGNVVSGASCGQTTAGAPIGAVCDGVAVPCQASLSCNSGVCEDRFGRCPY